MSLTTIVKQQLKGKAHKLRPLVTISYNGLTKNVNMEIDRALTDHELVKIRIQAEDREERNALLDEVIDTHKAELIQKIGNIAVLYRKSNKK